jgi:hypothetical protein
MFQYILQQLQANRGLQIITGLFIIYSVWWMTLYARGVNAGSELELWLNLIVIFPLLGGLAGLKYAKLWGGMKSLFGSSMLMLSFGLLAQFVGTIIYHYYIYIVGIEIPYPSVADIVYVAGIVFYIVGAYQLLKVSGVKFASLPWANRFLAISVPSFILLVSYLALMQNYAFEEATGVLIFLDFGWLIGQAIYVSLAIITYFASRKILGGMMRKPIVLLLVALILQYLADFHYSFQITNETYISGGINDYFYALAFFLMAAALFSIGNMFYKVKNS